MSTTLSINPLLEPSHLPHQATPFDRIRTEHFAPALDEGLKLARARIERLATDASTPTFVNTLEVLESASEEVDHVAHVFSNLLHAETNPELQALAKELLPKLAAFANDIYLDPRLFARVQAVHSRKSTLALTPEQGELLDRSYKSFVRNGARLSAADKGKIRAIDQRLSVVEQEFGDHVLKATERHELVLDRAEDLAGLPKSAIEAAAQAASQAATAKSRPELAGQWLFTLDFPSYFPFMKFSDRRELREKLWRAYQSRATAGDTDNRGLAIEIARLRAGRAKLLGYATHAHYVLEERMARDPKTVGGFLDRLLEASVAAARKDIAELKQFAAAAGDAIGELKQWDFAYYSEKLTKRKYSFDEEALRPYFKLENVIEGAFEHARRLYGIVLTPAPGVPVYHPDVQAYEARIADGEKSGELVGLFYADFFPRPGKQGGAWMTVYRDQGLTGGVVRRPHVSIVCNVTKPTPTTPSLLTIDETRTIFHEFGHSLHALLSDCRYRSLSGANVYWDFVELPSQIMENWVKEKEGLALFAKHYQTGAVIPDEWITRIQQVERFQSGWASLRQVSLARLDLAWHSVTPDQLPKADADVEAYERVALERTALLPPIPGTMISTSYTHIFSGGYSAGYYSYKWAEVLDADAFELFKEKGIFNREVATSFKEHILSRGGSVHPMELYKRFRGREPDPEALLRRDGLI